MANKFIELPFQPRLVINPITTKEYKIQEPRVSLWLSWSKKPIATTALIDSGATYSLLNAHLGEYVGIKLNKKKPIKILGIGNKELVAYAHPIKIKLDGTDWIETEAHFSYEQTVNLLGIYGFFNKFSEVSFRANEEVIKLTF